MRNNFIFVHRNLINVFIKSLIKVYQSTITTDKIINNKFNETQQRLKTHS